MMKQLTTLAAALVMAGAAGAATVVYSSGGIFSPVVNNSGGDDFSQTLSTLQLFSFDLGTLTGVKLTRSASMKANGTVTRRTTDGGVVDGTVDFLVTPVFTDVLPNFGPAIPGFAPALFGSAAFSLSDGASSPFTANSLVFEQEQDFVYLLGTSDFDDLLVALTGFGAVGDPSQFFSMSCSSEASSRGTSQQTVVESGTFNASCSASIEYTYTANVDPPTGVPEPGTLALVGLALAGLGLQARRRKAV